MTKKAAKTPKKKKPAVKPEGYAGKGRPSAFKPEYIEQAYNYALLGATDVQMAAFFGVSEQTLNTWKAKHPDFLESLNKGKAQADARVAQSLFHRACGYSHPEDKIFNNDGNPMVVATTKHYPPDTTAGIFWLKNRQKENWRDKVDHEHTGKNGGAIEFINTILGSIDGDTAGIPGNQK